MNRLVTSLSCALAIMTLSIAPALASPPNLTGTWKVQQTGMNGTTEGIVTITQSGSSFTATSKNGNGYTGTFKTDSQVDGKWHGPGGAGWLTIYVTPNGHSFNGTWGYNGRAANGSFTANKVLPPSPITAAGKWNLTGGSDAGMFIGPMTCTQSGPTVVCHVGGAIVMNGKFRTTDKVRATWSTGTQKGWFSFWFNGDNNSFNGVWGNGADSSPAVGRVVGQRKLQ